VTVLGVSLLVLGGILGLIACRAWTRERRQAEQRHARCESTLNVYATNGQYQGLFQMGDYARSRYGHGWDAWAQARAAYAYFRDAGWAPWECA
jgi:hypothetical protein